MTRPLTLLAAAALGAGCATGDRGDAAAGLLERQLRAQVLAELRAYYRDFSARDWEAFAGHFWPGATITTVWQPPGETDRRVAATSVQEFIAGAGDGPDSRAIFEERMDDAEVRLHGNLAQVWARYRARFGDPGAISEWSGYDAFTLIKHDGRWRITSLAFAASE